ncbi:MAG: LysR family transcriptional regulator [Rhodobacter sp.]|nr:LysR family transcriptional regulator [Rhodobacter sp.]
MSYVKTIKLFLRVYELGSMSAAARDQRSSPAVTSSRIAELEKHLGTRLFNRTTRALKPTEAGQIFYRGATRILATIEEAEAEVMETTASPKGTVFVSAPLHLGRNYIAPAVPDFKDAYPAIDVRLRMSDRTVDVTAEGLDLAFHIGPLVDSDLKIRVIADIPRILCAAPEYVAARGMPEDGEALIRDRHDCLNLRFPGAREFQWTLQTPDGPKRYEINGPFESDDGGVLTTWALTGRGIILKPVYEVAEHLDSGALVPVATSTPPTPTQLACLSPHRTEGDPKTRLFIEFMAARIGKAISAQSKP